jgi:hypothetical protein
MNFIRRWSEGHEATLARRGFRSLRTGVPKSFLKVQGRGGDDGVGCSQSE